MRSRTKWIAVAAGAALLLAGCSDAGQRGHKAPKPFTDFDALTLEQSACLFDCAVFEVKIFADGRVRHSGPSFEHTGGPHESRIDRRGLAQIARALREVRFDEMRDRYRDQADGCDITAIDMPSLTVSLSRGRGYRNKRVELNTGCVGPTVPTERIAALIDAIDRVSGTAALLEQRKQASGPDGRAAAPSR